MKMWRIAAVAYAVYALAAAGYIVLAVLLGARMKAAAKRRARRRAERDAERGWTADDDARVRAWARDRG